MNTSLTPAILDRAKNCLFVRLNSLYEIVDSNTTFNDLVFYPNSQNLNFPGLFSDSVAQNWQHVFSQFTGVSNNVVCLVIPISANGNTYTIDWNICPVMENNRIEGFELLGYIRSTHYDTKIADHNATDVEYCNSMFNNNPDAVLAIDPSGRFSRINNSFLELTGYTKDEIIGKELISIIDEGQRAEAATCFDRVLAGLSQVSESALLTKKGEKRIVSMTYFPLITNDCITGVGGIAKDVTHTTLLQKNLRKQEVRLRSILLKLKKILEFSLDIICTLDEHGIFLNVSEACVSILGYYPKELVGKRYIDFIHRDDVEKSRYQALNIRAGTSVINFENRFMRKDGGIAYLSWSSQWDEADRRFYSIARDASEKIKNEAALIASQEKYKILFYNHPLPTWIYDATTFSFLDVNKAALEQYGYSYEEFLNMKQQDILVSNQTSKFNSLHAQTGYYKLFHKGLWLHKRKNGEVIYCEITSNYIDFLGREAKLVLSNDVTEQVLAQQELLKSNKRYSFFSEVTFDAIWDWDFETGTIEWNEGAKKMFEIDNLSTIQNKNWWFENLHPEDRERVKSKLDDHIERRIVNWDDEYRFRIAENKYKYIYDRGYLVFDEKNRPVRMMGAMQDQTAWKANEKMLQKLNNSLEKRARELAESNSELERFAYVASHDLQEPLRMVTSFLQLLEKRYRDKLDTKANDYINYAVDGAERMKKLILDLLEYSRVNSSVIERENVDINEIIQDIKSTYRNILSENNGEIHNTPLPVVRANKIQILQLFQNLIGNAFKYKSERPPRVSIKCEEENNYYKFSVADNGIGISPKFFSKIFIIFQRLHNRDQYSGTGIGLAICKKIIDKHGGKIWVDSIPGEGSTFYFTLPKSK